MFDKKKIQAITGVVTGGGFTARRDSSFVSLSVMPKMVYSENRHLNKFMDETHPSDLHIELSTWKDVESCYTGSLED